MKDGKLVSLKCYHSIIDAKFDAEILTENGVECKVNTDTMVGIYPIFDDKERGIEILVFEKDKECALDILENYHQKADKK